MLLPLPRRCRYAADAATMPVRGAHERLMPRCLFGAMLLMPLPAYYALIIFDGYECASTAQRRVASAMAARAAACACCAVLRAVRAV